MLPLEWTRSSTQWVQPARSARYAWSHYRCLEEAQPSVITRIFRLGSERWESKLWHWSIFSAFTELALLTLIEILHVLYTATSTWTSAPLYSPIINPTSRYLNPPLLSCSFPRLNFITTPWPHILHIRNNFQCKILRL